MTIDWAKQILEGLQCGRPGCPCVRSARNGKGVTHCPAHGDAGTPSLSVSPPDRTTNPILHCFVGCSYDAISTELLKRNLWPGTTEYRAGAYVHERIDRWGQPKRMKWDTGAKPREVLYGSLDGVEPGNTVILVEGEKACEAARSRGWVSMATVCGASAIPNPDTLKQLDGFDVVLCPDNDDPGRKHMALIAAALTAPRWIELPGLPEKGDMADYTGTDDELQDLVDVAPLWKSEEEPGPCESSLIDWAEFWTSDPKAEDWLLEPVLPRGRSIAIYSPAKQGKSLLALDLAVHLATGQATLDRPACDPVEVVYLDMEMTEGDLYERLMDMGYGPETDLSHFHYYLLPNLPPLDTPEGGLTVQAIARRHAAVVVFIDTTSRVLQGAENDADTLRALYMYTGLPLKSAGITVVRLDHAGKDVERGQRGTSAKNDDVDLVWLLTAMDNGVTLKATHRRQSWVPEVVSLVRLDDPMRHARGAHTWQAGTMAFAKTLEEIGAPLNGIRKVREVMREYGVKASTDLVLDAMRWRRENTDDYVTEHPRNTPFEEKEEHFPEHPDFEPTEHPRNTPEHPPQGKRNSGSYYSRNTVPPSAQNASEEGWH